MAVVRSSSREYNSPERRSHRVMLKAPVVILTRGADCSVANYTRRSEGLASRSIVGNGVMEAVPVTGIPPWDRGMGQGEMRIFRFDLGQLVRISKHTLANPETLWDKLGSRGSFSPAILAIVPAVPARPCMRGGTGTGTCRATRAVRVSLAPCSNPDGRRCLYGR
jgi:hypothetical protein